MEPASLHEREWRGTLRRASCSHSGADGAAPSIARFMVPIRVQNLENGPLHEPLGTTENTESTEERRVETMGAPLCSRCSLW